jgi:membrane-bound ClpP family serine protease
VIEINLTNTIFLFCVLVGGGLLLLTILVDDILGGFLDALNIGIDFAGVSLVPLLLGFVSMFGVGGLLGTEILHLEGAPASLVGAAFGVLGAGFVTAIFRFLRHAEAAEAFSLQDMVGQQARVSVSIPAGRYGTVLLSFAGASHNLTATADVDIAAGESVAVNGVAGSNLIVAPLARPASPPGATSPPVS